MAAGAAFRCRAEVFQMHYLDELSRAIRNDTLPSGFTNEPQHGWRAGDRLTTTLEQVEGLNRELAEECRACGPSEKSGEVVMGKSISARSTVEA